jgi:hypothetical protein
MLTVEEAGPLKKKHQKLLKIVWTWRIRENAAKCSEELKSPLPCGNTSSHAIKNLPLEWLHSFINTFSLPRMVP